MDLDKFQSEISNMSLFECELIKEAINDRIKDIKSLVKNDINNKKVYTIDEFRERFKDSMLYDIKPGESKYSFYYAYDEVYCDLNVARDLFSFDEDCDYYGFTKVVCITE